jgi:CheY-like chemotaxis protein
MTKLLVSIDILWADDDEKQFRDCSATLGAFLQEHSLATHFTNANNGGEVFKFLTDRSYDLLILDVDMPRFGALAVLPEIHKRWPGMPMVVISRYATDPHVQPELERAVQLGMIHSFHDVEPREGYCEAVLGAISYKPPAILHLSDLHFGHSHAFQDISAEELFSAGLDQIRIEGAPNLVIFSGDFTSRGTEAEFARAREFVAAVCRNVAVPIDHTVIVPGNHDLDRAASVEVKRFSPFVDFLIALYSDLPDPAVAYAWYPELFDSQRKLLHANARNRGGEALYSISAFDSLRTVVIGLNSVTARDSEYDFGRLSAHQLLATSQRLAQMQPPHVDYFRIAVFHHNLFVVPSFRSDGEPERVVRNPALALHHLIEGNVKLILHGHTHYSIAHEYRPFFLDSEGGESRRTHVIATGALGAADREPSQPYAQATMIRCKLNDAGFVKGAAVTPFRLLDKRLAWKRGDTVWIETD